MTSKIQKEIDKYIFNILTSSSRTEKDVLDLFRGYSPGDINVNIRDHDDKTPLHMAAIMGYFNVVKTLIKFGSDVNAQDKRGNTPLHVATTSKIAKELVNVGAKVNSRNKYGDTPLHTLSNPESFVYYAGENIAKILINAGANVNDKNDYGDTPLHLASSGGNLELVKELVNSGANVNAENQNSFEDNYTLTPIEYATSYANDYNTFDVIVFLVKSGANIESCIRALKLARENIDERPEIYKKIIRFLETYIAAVILTRKGVESNLKKEILDRLG
jgi:ankyrin repeat protein